MPAAGPTFQALFSVVNQATGPLREIREEFGLVGKAAEHAGKRSAAATTHAHHSMGRFRGGIHLVHHGILGLNESIGETSGKLSELMPALAGLGAIGGIAGMFEFTAHMAEARAETLRMLKVTQLTPQAFGMLSYAASMTDTPVESVTKGVTRLNRVIADAASGKNKSAASLFAHLGISLRDANGHVISTSAALPKLMDGFRKNADEATRTRMAFALFGKGGAEMLPILTAGREELEEWGEQAKRIRYPFTKEDNEALEGFNQSWKRGTMAVSAFNNELSARLAPVLRPIVDQLTDWVTVNRSWIATDIAGGVKAFADEAKRLIDEAKKLDWHAYGEELHGVYDMANRAADAFGGWHNVIEDLIGLVVGRFALSFLAPLAPIASLGLGITRMAAGLVIQWGTVTAAAETAAAAEAAAAGGGAAAGAAGVVGTAGRFALGLGSAATGFGIAAGVNAGWNYLDPNDHMDTFLDKNLPGYAGADNFFSHIGMGRSYAEQAASDRAINGPPQRPRPTSAEQDASAVREMARLEQKGWSHANAAGFAASMIQESGGNPHAVGDGTDAYGAMQWHGDRAHRIAKHFGMPLSAMNLDQQVDAADWELRHGEEQPAWQRIQMAKTSFGSGAAVSRFYERPGDVEGNMRVRGHLAERYAAMPSLASPPAAATPVPQLYGPNATVQDGRDGGDGANGHVRVGIDVNNAMPGMKARVVSSSGSVLPKLNVGYGVGNSDADMLPGGF